MSLQEAEHLIATKIHPQTIITGWRQATDCARAALTAVAKDNSGEPEKFREVYTQNFVTISLYVVDCGNPSNQDI